MLGISKSATTLEDGKSYKGHKMSNFSAKLDPDIKTFRDLVRSGITPTAAYRRVYALARNISDQAAYTGGLRKMSRLNLLNPDAVSLNSTTQPIKKQVVQSIDNKEIAGTRKELRDRLWDTVRNGLNPESTAAAKQLNDWFERDDANAEASQIADPAIIAKHCASIAHEYADMGPALQLQYMARIIDALESCGLPRDHMRQILNRADDPPIQQVPDSIDPNALPKKDTPTISDPIQEKQCPLDANACPKAP
jgi:hypothetical protein